MSKSGYTSCMRMNKKGLGKVVVMGLGHYPQGSGVSSAKYLAKKGYQVVVTDLLQKKELWKNVQALSKYPNVSFRLGEHRKSDFQKALFVAKNPRVPFYSPYLKGKKVINDIGLFLKSIRNKNIFLIAVTGTRGKSTISALVYKILKTAGFPAHLAGNIGNSPLNLRLKDGDYVVLEISSWQLHDLHRPRFPVAVISNIFPDHLNYYRNMEEYRKDKKIIFLGQEKNDILILNPWNRFTRAMVKQAPGKVVWLKREKIRSKLLGKHNEENIGAAVAVGKSLGIAQSVMDKAVKHFSGLPHRLQLVRKVNGVMWYDDSASTTPDATIAALHTFRKKVILISGGNSKNLPLEELNREIKKRVKHLILYHGNVNAQLPPGKNIFSIQEAVEEVWNIAKSGDVALFSPGFVWLPKIDEFRRGEEFQKYVKSLNI